MTTHYTVHVEWDAEASVWYVSTSNVPGLATAAPTLDAMMEKLAIMVPEMLEENGQHVGNAEVPFELLAQRHAASRRAA